MSDLKASLKEAKLSIKDKDYEAAMIHCKDALKIDRKNYQALAMFGRACLELRRYTDSKKALLLATQIDPENAVAWQGLSSLHEKEPKCFEKSEEIAILNHLKDITKEEEKLDRLYRRLASVYQRYDCPLEAALSLESLLTILKDKLARKEVHKSIISILTNVEDPSIDVQEKLIEHYSYILNDTALSENESNYKCYLRLLYKTKNFKRLMEAAREMARYFPTAYPLEWIARAYVEGMNFSCQSQKDEEELITDEAIVAYIKKLLLLYRESPWGNFAQGLIEHKNGNIKPSKLHMKRGCEYLEKNLHAWMAFLDVQVNSGDVVGIETTCRKVDSLLEPVESFPSSRLPSAFASAVELKQFLLTTRVDALFKLGQTKYLHQAVTLLEEVENKGLETSILLVRAQVKLGMLAEARREVDRLMEEFEEPPAAVRMIEARLVASEGDFDTARSIYGKILQEDATNADALFEMGRMLFQMGEYQKSLIHLLKAAKYNPGMSCCFLYIGHYYRWNDNLDKARKCYEKALQLNPSDEEAGASLSDVYRIMGKDEENFALLVRVTNEGKSGWAWLRLGLHYLSLSSHSEAIIALQRAVEINPKDNVCLECLGDAYLARGSLTAALKVFTKTTELHPGEDYLYPRCRIAYINHMVGEYLLSIAQYEQVLSKILPNAVRVVALVGLAEVLLTRAKKYRREYLLSNMRDDCLYAIKCLTKAACEDSSSVTIWKLLGDACTLQAALPPSLAKFEVPVRLLDPAESDLNRMKEISKEDILSLGGRCYGVGIQVKNDNAYLWHDLGVNVFLQGYSNMKISKRAKAVAEDGEDLQHLEQADYLQRALTSVKKSLSIDPASYNAWNSLGVIAFFRGDYPLAQHAFIHSLKLHPTVEGWTHLGALYLHQKDAYLAHEAFSQAQALDPIYVVCWVGQAMVATAVGHHEAFDLYQHTTMLGIHPESCVGFASNVLERVCAGEKCSSNDTKNVNPLISTVVDSLSHYARERENDAIAQNMLGLTLEMVGLKQSASEAFSKAVQTSKDNGLKDDVCDGILSNYSRSLTSLSEFGHAIENYSLIKEPDFFSQCGLALSLLKNSQFEEAYQRYMDAYEWYAPDETQKSNVLVAMAVLQYKFENVEEVKTLLFRSSSVQGLMALTSLGLIQGDPTLTDAALAELEPYADSKEYAHHVSFLKATQATLQNNPKEAKLILSRAVHRHPHNSALWRSLSQHMLSSPESSAAAANAAASSARALAQAARDNTNVFQDVVLKTMANLKVVIAPPPPVEPTASAEGGKRKKRDAAKTQNQTSMEKQKNHQIMKETHQRLSLVDAQRAVLMCPSKPETWAVLIAAINSKKEVSKLARKWSEEAQPPLKSWFESVSVL